MRYRVNYNYGAGNATNQVVEADEFTFNSNGHAVFKKDGKFVALFASVNTIEAKELADPNAITFRDDGANLVRGMIDTGTRD